MSSVPRNRRCKSRIRLQTRVGRIPTTLQADMTPERSRDVRLQRCMREMMEEGALRRERLILGIDVQPGRGFSGLAALLDRPVTFAPFVPPKPGSFWDVVRFMPEARP